MNDRIIEIRNPDIAAAVMLATGSRPTVLPDPHASTMLFEFPNSIQAREAMMDYASGTLCQNIPQFAACRGLIYRLIREAGRKGANHE